MTSAEYIPCGHPIDWRWKSTPTDGAFCVPCQRVYPILTPKPEEQGPLTPTAFLQQLQAESGQPNNQFHAKHRIWVDDNSGAARALRLYEEALGAEA